MLAVVGFFAFVNLYALRVNMSVAMVCMVNQTALLDTSRQDNVTAVPADDTCVARTQDHTVMVKLIWTEVTYPYVIELSELYEHFMLAFDVGDCG